MTTNIVFTKDPDAVLDYKWDWKPKTNGTPNGQSDWLATNETISTHTVTSSSTDLVVASSSQTDTNTSVTAWLSGGVAGTKYKVKCHITTSAGRQDDRTIVIDVKHR